MYTRYQHCVSSRGAFKCNFFSLGRYKSSGDTQCFSVPHAISYSIIYVTLKARKIIEHTYILLVYGSAAEENVCKGTMNNSVYVRNVNGT